MHPTVLNLAALIGRILLALMFVLAGFNKIGSFDGTVGYIASRALPLPAVVAVLTIVLEIGAGLALMAGWRARWAAVALAAFTLLATAIFHAFWAMPAEQHTVQMLMFLKNLSVTGGLLLVFALGPGGWSIDARRGA